VGVQEQGSEVDICPGKYAVTEERRRLRKEKPHDLYFSPNIIQVIKSRSLR
jgi:hypothetical protein